MELAKPRAFQSGNLSGKDASGPSAVLPRGAHLMRLLLGGAGLAYFWTAGTVTGFLPLAGGVVLAVIAAYSLLNGLLWLGVLRAGLGLTVPLDLAILAVIVLEDPYPAAPVTVLLLSTIFDYGRWLRPAAFSGAFLAALAILLLNLWARLHSARFPLAAEAAWLSAAIGLLMLNFFAVARAAAAVRAERRRMAARIEQMRQREEDAVRLQLRLARVGASLQFTDLPCAEFAEQALACFVRELGAAGAAVYQLSQEPGGAGLYSLATYAADLRRLQQRHIGLDEGVVGACAARGKPIELQPVPEGYFQLQSGLGQGAPRCLLVLPLKLQTRLVGVLELALHRLPGAEERELLERMLPVFAAGLLVVARAETRCAAAAPAPGG